MALMGRWIFTTSKTVVCQGRGLLLVVDFAAF